MPVRVWSTGGSGGSKGYSIYPCTDLKLGYNPGEVLLRWTDPDDTDINGEVVAPWTHTIVVRKEGSFPTSIKDGIIVLKSTVKNAYKDTYYVDNTVANNITYYYSVFAMSGNIASDDVSKSITPKEYSPILSNNDWYMIEKASEEGIANQLWNVGDEIDVEVAGGTYTFQIYGFAIDDKADGSGKAGITFGMKHLLSTKYYMLPNNLTSNVWSKTILRNDTIAGFFNNMQSEVKSVIKPVKKASGSAPEMLTENLFIPSGKEVGLTYNCYANETNKCETYPIFTDNNSRIKKLNNGKSNASVWWLRSPYTAENRFNTVMSDGSYNTGTTDLIQWSENGICLCFCV